MSETDIPITRAGRFRTTRFPGVVGGGLDDTISPSSSTNASASPAPIPIAPNLRNAPIGQDGDPEATPANEPGGFTGDEFGAAVMGAAFSAAGLGLPALAMTAARGIGKTDVFSDEPSGQGPGPGGAAPNDLGSDNEPGNFSDDTADNPGNPGGPASGEDTGQGPDTAPDDVEASSGGGGAGDAACVMTTALNDLGDWSDSEKRVAVDWCRRTHHDGSRRGAAWVSGYHVWGGCMAWIMRRSKVVRRTIRPMMNAFTDQATGRNPNLFGFIIKYLIVDPMSYGIGAVTNTKGKNDAAK